MRNHRYRLFHPETGGEVTWTRASTLAKTLESTYNLERWKLRKVVEGLGLREDLRALAISIKAADPDSRDQYQEVASKAMEAAKVDAGANRGTAFHSIVEALDRGETPRYPDDQWRKDAESYVREMDAFGLRPVPELIERYIVCPDLELCGRLDRVLTQDGAPGAPCLIGDTKSADKIEYGWLGIAVQLAVYAHASHYWSPERDDWVPMPPMNHKVGVVMHTKIGAGQTLIRPIDIEAGWRAAQLSREVRRLRSASRNLELGPDALSASLSPSLTWSRRIGQADSRAALAAIWEAANARSEWSADLQRAGVARMAEIERAGL